MKRKKICSIITAAVVTASLTVQGGYQVKAAEKPSVSSVASSVRGAATNGLDLKMSMPNTQAQSGNIAATYTLKNVSDSDIDLGGVAINYYYSADNDKHQNFTCDYSGGMVGGNYKNLTQSITGKLEQTGESGDRSDRIAISFASDSGSLKPGEEITVQFRVYKDDWSNYDQSNDYSFNDVDKVEVLVNGNPGPGPGPKPVEKDAVLKSTEGTFDLAHPEDLFVGMELNGNQLNSIKNVTKNETLTSGVDYKADDTSTTLLKKYLSKLAVGTYTLTFDFGRNRVNYTVKVIDSGAVVKDAVGVKIGDASGKQDETVTVPVELTNVPEKGIYGYSFTIKYDNKKFDGVEVTPTDLNPSAEDNFIATVDEEAGTIKISYVSSQIDDSETIFKNGKIADISFHIKKSAPVGIYDVDAEVQAGSAAYVNDDYTTGAYVIKYDNGSIEVVDKDIKDLNVSVGKAEGKPGETVTVPVEISSVDPEGVYGYSFTIKYDSKKFDGVKVVPTDLNPSAEDNFIATVDEEAGTIKISYVSSQIDDSETIFKDGKIADISFHIKDTTEEGTYDLDLVDEAGNAAYVNDDYSTGAYKVVSTDGSIEVGKIPPRPVKDLEVAVGEVQAATGEKVTVPVEISSVDEEGVYGYSFTIKYDNTKFDGVEVRPTDLNPSAEDNFIATVDEEAGTIKISYVSSQIDDSETIFKNGKIADIDFHVKDATPAGTYKLDLVDEAGNAAYVNADYSTGAYKVVSTDGAIKVTPNSDLVNFTIGNETVAKDGKVNVPVSLDKKSKKGVYGYSFTVKYDNTKFDGVEVTPTDLNPSAEDNFIATIDEEAGIIKISYVSSTIDDSETIFENGKIADITLHAKKDAEAGKSKLDILGETANAAYVNDDYSTGAFNVMDTDGFVTIVDGEQPEQDSTLKTSKVTYNPEEAKDIEVGVNFNGNKLVSINDGTKDLVEGKDYTVTSTGVVLSKSYLDTLAQGKTAELTFKFSAGKDATLSVKVLEKKVEVKDSTINPTSVEFTKGEAEDTTIDLTLNGNKLVAIKDAAGKAVKFTDKGDSVVISKDYLNTLEAGTTELTFEFSAGKSATLTVKVNEAKPQTEGQVISVDSIKAKAGDTITVPVKITGTPAEGIGCFSIELGFDTKYLEFVSATAGDIVTNAKSNFSADYFKEDSIVSSFFTYNKKKADQIVKDGTYMNVTFKVKSGVKGTTKLTVDPSAVISAKPSREDIPFTVSVGNIVIE
ncbi:MAG: hypothetical protein E7214_09190 [Clostridium sp.]|nr:hypothetical protein [Clostridium sp.]